MSIPHARSPDEANKVAAATVAPVAPLPLEPPTCLFIQTEYCKAQTLYHWLRENINNRPRKTVANYFEQVSVHVLSSLLCGVLFVETDKAVGDVYLFIAYPLSTRSWRQWSTSILRTWSTGT